MRVFAIWTLIAVLGFPVWSSAEDKTQGSGNGTAVPSAAPLEETPKLPSAITELILNETVAATPKGQKYWIGLSCTSVDETLRAQLELPADGGLIVRQIAKNSPGDDAKFAVHDVITQITVEGQTHKPANPADLNRLVQQTGTKPMTFVLLRRGKSLNITITPKDQTVKARMQPVYVSPQTTMIQATRYPVSYRMVGSVYTVDGLAPAANLPDDITVIITKSGSQPVGIKIQQKDRGEWGLQEKESALQPEHVSQAVNNTLTYLGQLVGRMGQHDGQPVYTLEPAPQPQYRAPLPATIVRPAPIYGPGPGFLPTATVTNPSPTPTLSSIQQRLDDLQKQHEQTMKTIEELRQALKTSLPTK